jgi:hypothetical protein
MAELNSPRAARLAVGLEVAVGNQVRCSAARRCNRAWCLPQNPRCQKRDGQQHLGINLPLTLAVVFVVCGQSLVPDLDSSLSLSMARHKRKTTTTTMRFTMQRLLISRVSVNDAVSALRLRISLRSWEQPLLDAGGPVRSYRCTRLDLIQLQSSTWINLAQLITVHYHRGSVFTC